MPVIQATTIGGEIVEKARWEVASLLNVQVGHSISVSLNTADKDLLNYVRRQNKQECAVDQSESNALCVVMNFAVKQMKHMVDGNRFDSMCIVVPASRYAEQIMLYVLAPGMCGRRFSEAIRG